MIARYKQLKSLK